MNVLLSSCLVTFRRYTHGWEGFMKYTVEMGSGDMIHIPAFIKIGSGIQKLMVDRRHY
jgi:hypothetical protein